MLTGLGQFIIYEFGAQITEENHVKNIYKIFIIPDVQFDQMRVGRVLYAERPENLRR